MPAEPIIAETGVATDSIKSESRLSVVVAYGGIAAGKHAMCVLNRLSSRLCGGIEFFPILWSFDMLSDRDASEEAMGDAVNADILVVATIDIGPLPMGVAWWLDSVIRAKDGMAAAVIALFGPEENPDGDGSFRVEALRTIVHRTGLSFFTPQPAGRHDGAVDRILCLHPKPLHPRPPLCSGAEL